MRRIDDEIVISQIADIDTVIFLKSPDFAVPALLQESDRLFHVTVAFVTARGAEDALGGGRRKNIKKDPAGPRHEMPRHAGFDDERAVRQGPQIIVDLLVDRGIGLGQSIQFERIDPPRRSELSLDAAGRQGFDPDPGGDRLGDGGLAAADIASDRNPRHHSSAPDAPACASRRPMRRAAAEPAELTACPARKASEGCVPRVRYRRHRSAPRI